MAGLADFNYGQQPQSLPNFMANDFTGDVDTGQYSPQTVPQGFPTSIPNDVSSYNRDYTQGLEQPNYMPPQQPKVGEYDNYFRAGSVGLSGLGIAAGIYDANRARRQREDALKKLDASMDPNVGFYQSELKRMMSDPNGYLTDVATQNQLGAAREQMLRQARAQGRSTLSAQELQQLQSLASGAYQQRIKTLQGLVGGNDTLKATRAQIAAQPSGYNVASAIPHLQDIFTTGRDYAVSEGLASPRPVDPVRQARRSAYYA